jgi:hypothetical protein
MVIWLKNELPINHTGSHILWRPYGCFLIGISGGSNKLDFSKGGILTFYTTNSGFTNDWQQLVITRSNNNFSIYRNGSIETSISSNVTFQDYGNLIFGKANGAGGHNGSYYFQGALDDIRIYNRALTQSEITYLATH